MVSPSENLRFSRDGQTPVTISTISSTLGTLTDTMTIHIHKTIGISIRCSMRVVIWNTTTNIVLERVISLFTTVSFISKESQMLKTSSVTRLTSTLIPAKNYTIRKARAAKFIPRTTSALPVRITLPVLLMQRKTLASSTVWLVPGVFSQM